VARKFILSDRRRKQMAFYRRIWLGFFFLYFFFYSRRLLGIRWQMKETVFLVYEIESYTSED
jgi:hypothetical protein